MNDVYRFIAGFLVGIWLALYSSAFANPVLQASVQVQHRAPIQKQATGVVLDSVSHRPLNGAHIVVPNWGLQTHTHTQADGSFYLSRQITVPTIVSIQKPGYAPQSITLQPNHNNSQPFTITLKQQAAVIVLDQNIHHLGDNAYAAHSAAAGKFKRSASGPAIIKQFMLSQSTPPKTLFIGSVVGLDTLAARQAGQSKFHKFSSPMQVKLNGVTIGQIALNGDGHRLALPTHLLKRNALNTLEIQTGYHRPDGHRIDFDDMELMHLTLEF